MYAKEKREYVKKLNEVMEVAQDFGGIKYANDRNTGAEYMKVWDIVGGAQFFDITGYSLDCILRDATMLVLGKVPDSIVTDTEKKREIARLFRIQERL